MGILRLLPFAWRSHRRPRPGRRRPALLRAEELEPRTLPSVSLLDGVAYPTYILSPGPAPGRLVGAPGAQPAGTGGATPAFGPGGTTPAFQPNQSPPGYWPSQIRHVYNIDQLNLDGTGQTIAIVDA
ncbi:MAG TPA: hypothetical protein VFE78_30485, partial [Gemmataceae bacterium]|nr:hypothetical protein [Gemmataceae bacterium]